MLKKEVELVYLDPALREDRHPDCNRGRGVLVYSELQLLSTTVRKDCDQGVLAIVERHLFCVRSQDRP